MLRARCYRVELVRFDAGPTLLEAAFYVDFKDAAGVSATCAELRALADGTRVTLLDSRGIV